MLDHQHIADMISGYLDGELTQGDRQRVEIHLDACPQCRKTYEEMAGLREAVGNLSFGEMSPDEWNRIMNDVVVRSSRGFGWVLGVVGLLLLAGYAAYTFSVDRHIPALVKTGVVGMAVGTVLLFVSVLRQRLISRRTDKYKDVEI